LILFTRKNPGGRERERKRGKRRKGKKTKQARLVCQEKSVRKKTNAVAMQCRTNRQTHKFGEKTTRTIWGRFSIVGTSVVSAAKRNRHFLRTST
jgi:hypothetical protein